MTVLRLSTLLCTSLLICSSSVADGLSVGERSAPKANNQRREILTKLPLFVVAAATQLLHPNAATAAGYQDDLRNSLAPASEDQPQIPLPTSPDPTSSTTVVEGLLSLKDPRSEVRPGAADTVILTVRDLNHPDIVIAGARLPVSRIRFPLRFRLTTANLVPDKAAIWTDSAFQHDLLVQAVVCPDATTTTCSASSDTAGRIQAKGLAKLLRLQDQGIDIRAAVALPLE